MIIALDTFAFAVDQTHFVKAGVFALAEILIDEAVNFFGLKRMKIEMILDRNYDRNGKWRVILAAGHVAVIFFTRSPIQKRARTTLLPSVVILVFLWLISVPAFIAF